MTSLNVPNDATDATDATDRTHRTIRTAPYVLPSNAAFTRSAVTGT